MLAQQLPRGWGPTGPCKAKRCLNFPVGTWHSIKKRDPACRQICLPGDKAVSNFTVGPPAWSLVQTSLSNPPDVPETDAFTPALRASRSPQAPWSPASACRGTQLPWPSRAGFAEGNGHQKPLLSRGLCLFLKPTGGFTHAYNTDDPLGTQYS